MEDEYEILGFIERWLKENCLSWNQTQLLDVQFTTWESKRNCWIYYLSLLVPGSKEEVLFIFFDIKSKKFSLGDKECCLVLQDKLKQKLLKELGEFIKENKNLG